METKNKTILRCRGIIQKRLEKVMAEREDAQGNYDDTGYLRYANKLDKLDDEITELTNFLHPYRAINEARKSENRARAQLNDMREMLRGARESIRGLAKKFPDDKGVELLWRYLRDCER